MLYSISGKRKEMRHIRMVVFFLLSFVCCSLGAQTEEERIFIEEIVVEHDSITVSTNTPPVITYDGVADPHKATLWALLPGGGQIYNWSYGDKWWIASLKLTAIYGGFGTLAYFTVLNTNDYRDFREAYKWVSSKEESGKKNKYTDGYTETQLQSYMNYYRTNMEWCYFFTALLYGLQIVEATVTAHLLTFDVSDNLSFSVKPLHLPDFSSSAFNSAIGLSLRYKVQYK